jgi:phosphate transport system substrate-binding protein
MEKVSEAYQANHPDIELRIRGGGSGGGLMALLKGEADIAATSYVPTPEDYERFTAQSIYPILFRIAYDSIIPVVHPSNPVKDLSKTQLRDIFSGKIKNWSAVGGKNMPIKVIDRSKLSGTHQLWHNTIMGSNHTSADSVTVDSNMDVISLISQQRGSIGYIGLGYLNIRIKPVSVNGEIGSTGNSKNGDYLLSRPLFLVTRNWPSGQVMNFIDFVMHPDKGQRLIEETGYTPLY